MRYLVHQLDEPKMEGRTFRFYDAKPRQEKTLKKRKN